MAFKPIQPKEYFINKITREIVNFEWNWYYKPILDILKPNSVINENDAIFNALKSGALYYQNGAFYSKSGRFSNTIAKELEKIGARYSKYGRCYRITKNKIPDDLLWVIETTNAKVYSDVLAIRQIMDKSIGDITEAIKNIKVEDVVEQMFFDLQDRVEKNFKENKIEMITPKLTDYRAKALTENYIENLELGIKNWQEKDIIKMREVVGQMAIKGESRITIQNYIETQFKVSQSKAKFLTRNESSIATTEYLKATYQENGSEEFKWVAAMDERTRDEHRKLNGNIFRYDNPPIIDERTGTRGMPAEFYNCRCTFIPIFKKNIKQNV